MQDITKYIDKKNINNVMRYVYKVDNESVATDNYRLVVETIPNEYVETIPNGYYTPEIWKSITKEINDKKKTVEEKKKFIEMYCTNNALLVPEDLSAYPNYRQLVRETRESDSIQHRQIKLQKKLYLDFIAMIPDDIIELSQIKLNQRAMFYENKTTKLILMYYRG